MAVLIGGVAIRWYSHLASISILKDLKKAEGDAAATGNPIIVNAMIAIRTIFDTCGWGVGLAIAFCLLGVGLGLLLGVRRMRLRASAQTQVKVSFPRLMLLALAWQMTALWVAAMLALIFLFVVHLVAS